MRVGIDATAVLDELTGTEVHTRTAIAALAEHSDHELVVFVRRRPPTDWPFPDGVEVWPLRASSQALATQLLLPWAARRARVDVLFCPAKPPPALRGAPVLVTVHDAVPWTRPETMGSRAAIWFRVLHRIAVRRGAHVATPLRASATEVSAVLPVDAARLHVVGNALAPWLHPSEPGPNRPALAGSGPYVLSLCRIEPRKDLGTVLDAWRQVRASRPRHRLLLAGPVGWKVSEVVDRARRTPSVELLGRVPSADIAGLYAHAEAFVTASREEGFGLPVLEAMALGAPVVASAIPAHLEVAADAAELFAPGDAPGLARALDRVLGDPARATALRCAGHRRARGFSGDAFGRALVSALEASAR